MGSARVVIAVSDIAAQHAGNGHVGINGEPPITDTRIRRGVGCFTVFVNVRIGCVVTGFA